MPHGHLNPSEQREHPGIRRTSLEAATWNCGQVHGKGQLEWDWLTRHSCSITVGHFSEDVGKAGDFSGS